MTKQTILFAMLAAVMMLLASEHTPQAQAEAPGADTVTEERLCRMPTGHIRGLARSADGLHIAWIERMEATDVDVVVMDGQRGSRGYSWIVPDSPNLNP